MLDFCVRAQREGCPKREPLQRQRLHREVLPWGLVVERQPEVCSAHGCYNESWSPTARPPAAPPPKKKKNNKEQTQSPPEPDILEAPNSTYALGFRVWVFCASKMDLECGAGNAECSQDLPGAATVALLDAWSASKPAVGTKSARSSNINSKWPPKS